MRTYKIAVRRLDGDPETWPDPGAWPGSEPAPEQNPEPEPEPEVDELHNVIHAQMPGVSNIPEELS